MIFRTDLAKHPPEALWKRALRNRKHWDHHLLVTKAFELARQFAAEEADRVDALRAREAAKQKQIIREKEDRTTTTIAPLPIFEAPPCLQCNGRMEIRAGIEFAVHVKGWRACPQPSLVVPPRVTIETCVGERFWRGRPKNCTRPAVTAEKLCAGCALKLRQASRQL
jgi:hypothetical protein